MASAVPMEARAQDADTTLTWDAFVDAYYAWDFDRPEGGARAYATQPARHNEFNLNLALVRARYDADRARGVLGVAIGTYMESNYAAEPVHFRHLYEASAGYRLGGSNWVEIGVLPSHIGLESAISALNLTYSRSLAAEFSPYYETGVRWSFAPSARFSGAALVLNGWQNIRETNDGKAVSVALEYRPVDELVLHYANYLGDETPSGDDDSVTRFFNDFYAQWVASEAVTVAGVFDIGTQSFEDSDDATWWNATLLGRVWLTDEWGLALRGEYFDDPDQVVVSTGTDFGFTTVGGSIGIDYKPTDSVIIRLEGRGFSSDDPVWPTHDGSLKKSDGFLVSSIAVTF